MVRKVVIPATISVLTLVLFSLSLNIRSSICVLPRLSRRVCGHCPVQNQPRLLSSPAKLGRCRRHTATEGSETSSVTHDPSVGVRRRHLPLLRKGRKTGVLFAFAGRVSYSPRPPRTPRARTQP